MKPIDSNLPPLRVGSSQAGRPALLVDLEDLPDTVTGEIIDGRLLVSARGAPVHAEVASALGALLINPLRLGIGGPGGWILIDKPQLHLEKSRATDESNALVPDLSGWRRERLPERPLTAFYEVVPDWICQVLSPATAVDARVEKMPVYARVGVKWTWLIDPVGRTLEGYELVANRWAMIAVHRDNQKVRVAPFDAFELDLRLLWEH